MRCEQVGEMMSARLDGRLASAASETLDSHLAGCGRCRGEWDALWSVDQLLAASPVLSAPANLHLQVAARLERRQRVRQAAFGALALGLGTVVLALLATSPVLFGLWKAGTALPMWETGGREAARVIVSLLGTGVRLGATVLRAFALPIAGIAVCVMFLTVLTNGLWIGALYRLRAAA